MAQRTTVEAERPAKSPKGGKRSRNGAMSASASACHTATDPDSSSRSMNGVQKKFRIPTPLGTMMRYR